MRDNPNSDDEEMLANNDNHDNMNGGNMNDADPNNPHGPFLGPIQGALPRNNSELRNILSKTQKVHGIVTIVNGEMLLESNPKRGPKELIGRMEKDIEVSDLILIHNTDAILEKSIKRILRKRYGYAVKPEACLMGDLGKLLYSSCLRLS